ncbi:11778_t:CDS:1, partial [Rhizophagus irregularis]
MSVTENYIGFEELVFYLNESRKISYHGFLDIYRNTIIASLSQLTNFPLEKWQNFNIAWTNRFLDNAKELLDSNAFTELKKK